jgi:hypothetical protein
MFVELTELFVDWTSDKETEEQPLLLSKKYISSIRPGDKTPEGIETTVLCVYAERIQVKGKYEDIVEMIDKRRGVA